MTVHARLRGVFQAWGQANVRWCLLSNPADLAAPAGPVRVLFALRDRRRVGRILEQDGFVRVPALNAWRGRLFVAYDPRGNRWLTMQITSEIAAGPGIPLPAHFVEGALARCRHEGLLALPAPADAFWLALVPAISSGSTMTPPQAVWLQQLSTVASATGPLARAVEAACPPGWTAARVMARARAADWQTLQALATRLSTHQARRGPLVAGWAATWKQGRRFADLAFALRRRGLSVALLGPDGAGKSTLAAGIGRASYFPVRRVYMGLWQGPVTAPPRVYIPGREIGARLLRAWGPYLTGRYHQARGRLVIFDRYTYDALAGRPSGANWRSRLYYWVLGHACPPPDLVLVLDVPGAVMYQRKGEHSPEALERQRQRFLAISRQLRRAAILDGTRPPEAVCTAAVARIWQTYATVWSRK